MVGEESDSGEDHLDRVAMWSTLRLARAGKLSAALHASQCRGDQAAPFGEVTCELDAGVFVAVGQLETLVPQHTAERHASPPVVRDQFVAPR